MAFVSIPKSLSYAPSRAPSHRLSELNLPDFIKASGVKLELLQPSQLGYFLAARALVSVIRELKLPSSEKVAGVDKRSTSSARVDDRGRESDLSLEHFPTELLTIGPAKVCDLKHILPHQLCYPEETLLFLLQNGKIQRHLMYRSVDTENEERRATESESCKPDPRQKDSTAQRTYLLLDVSQSMNGDRSPDRKVPDQRGTIARGLALACVYEAKDRGTEIHLRPFSSTVGERESSRSSGQMTTIVDELRMIKNSGSTALQAGLAAVAKDLGDIESQGRVDVMLITDGVSHLGENPIGGMHLHTFLIGDSVPSSSKGAGGVLDKLTGWSETFRRIWDSDFARYLQPRTADILAFENLLSELMERIPNCKDTQELREMQNLVALSAELLKLCESSSLDNTLEGGRFIESIRHAQSLLSSDSLASTVTDQERHFNELCDLYDSHLPDRFRQSNGRPPTPTTTPPHLSFGGKGTYSDQSLSLLLRALWNTVLRYVRKINPARVIFEKNHSQ